MGWITDDARCSVFCRMAPFSKKNKALEAEDQEQEKPAPSGRYRVGDVFVYERVNYPIQRLREDQGHRWFKFSRYEDMYRNTAEPNMEIMFIAPNNFGGCYYQVAVQERID